MPPKKPSPDAPERMAKKRAVDKARKAAAKPGKPKTGPYDTGGNNWYGFDGMSGQPKDKSQQGD